MKHFLIATVGAAMLALAPSAALAQTSPIQLTGDVKVSRVVVENGKERRVLVEPSVVVPGDALVFTTTYRNNGQEVAKDVVVTNPLPAAIMLAPEGAEKLMVSVDGGKSFGLLASLRVKDAEGRPRAAQASDVTHIRWVVPVVPAGAQGALSYNGIVR